MKRCLVSFRVSRRKPHTFLPLHSLFPSKAESVPSGRPVAPPGGSSVLPAFQLGRLLPLLLLEHVHLRPHHHLQSAPTYLQQEQHLGTPWTCKFPSCIQATESETLESGPGTCVFTSPSGPMHPPPQLQGCPKVLPTF